MSKTIYVVHRESGEYEEFRSTPVHAWTDRGDADKQVTELTTNLDTLNAAIALLRVFRENYGEEGKPVLDRTLLKNNPQKGPHKNQTKAILGEVAYIELLEKLRKLRKEVSEYNTVIYDAHYERLSVWENERDAKAREHLKSLKVSMEYIERASSEWSEKDAKFVIKELELD